MLYYQNFDFVMEDEWLVNARVNDPGLIRLKAKVKQRMLGTYVNMLIGILIGYILNYFGLFFLCLKSSKKFKCGLLIGIALHVVLKTFIYSNEINNEYDVFGSHDFESNQLS